ncbi:MAG TPA: hypothetical protein VHV10_13475 [Ktedonobacteraceae bacterium]|nr:hypothetical protein [Ktedonobacteraceae bacterium]
MTPQVSSNKLTTLNFASELTLNNMPGPSTAVHPSHPLTPPSQTTEVDAKPESHILPPQVSAEDEAANDFAEKMKDLQKVVSDMFQVPLNSNNNNNTVGSTSTAASNVTSNVANNAEHVALASFGQRMTTDPKPLAHQPRTFVHRISADAPLLNSWSVYCNNCEKNMLNEHYHCNVCDGGDYDLCLECMEAGVHCPGETHWLIKRIFNPNGSIVTSVTEKVGPKPKAEPVKEMPGAFTEEKKADDLPPPTRTCNCCVKGRRKYCSCCYFMRF